jgi:cytochrome bd-type quinol oxidase subunit 2
MYKTFFIAVVMLLGIPFAQSQAVGNLNDAGKNLIPAKSAAGYQERDIGSITGQVINTALQLVGIIFLGLMVYAGYLWMTAAGEESQVEKAQKIVTSAIIGLVLTMSAYAITTLVTSRFSNGPRGPAGSSNNGPEMIDNDCNRCIDACAGKPQACFNACDAGVCAR